MSASGTFNAVLSWAAKNERRLGAALFVFGFVSDILTFGLLPVGYVSIFFAAYLGLAALCTFGTHLIPVAEITDSWWRRTLAVVFPLVGQYALGNLLSGLVVFYTKSSVVAAAWPFLLLLVVAYLGSEYFRTHKSHLVFQTSIFFFVLYAYAIFALPLFMGVIGPWIFLGSSLLAAAAFALFLLALRLINRSRYLASRTRVILSSLAIILVVNAAYFTGVIPPIPLALKAGGTYHDIRHEAGEYYGTTEGDRAWWDLRTPVVHISPGQSMYAYSAVGAPIRFSSTVVHRWERYDDGLHAWQSESVIRFPIAGGREGGYRGYSTKENLSAGKWRVSVETESGQVIGRIRFDIERTGSPAPVVEVKL